MQVKVYENEMKIIIKEKLGNFKVLRALGKFV